MRDVRSLGWHFVSEWSCDRSHDSRLVMLAQIPGALSVSVDDIREFIMARIFKTLLKRWTLHHHTERTVQVTLKAWNTVVWKGQIRAGQSCHAFVSLWNLTMSIFGLSTPPRFVCCGKQMNPEWNIMDFVGRFEVPMAQITIHLVKAIHGGSNSSDSDVMSIQSSPTGDERSTQSDDEGFERDVSNMLEHWLDIHGDFEFFPVSLAWFQRHHVTVLQQAIVLEGHIDRILPIMKAINKLGLESTLYAFGWHMILKFLSFDAPIKVRMIIEPMNTWEPGDTERVVAFIMSALFVASLPDPSPPSVHAVRVSMKLWHTWAVDAQFPGGMLLSVVDDTWQCISAFMDRHSSIRLITRGRSASIDFPICDFAKVGSDGRLCVKFIIVLPLHGGGPSQKMLKSENNIATKNTLAAFLLSLGCDLQSVSSFVQKMLDATGPVAIDQIMKIQQTQKKHEALSQLAVSMSIQFPDINSAASKRMHQVQKKVTAKGIPPQIIQPEQFTIKDGLFCNEDKSRCGQITNIRAGASGIALVTPDTAAQWLKCDSKISADELALITLGTCPASAFSSCAKIQFPVFDKEGQPAVLAGCIHQLGQKKVTFGDSKQCDVAVADTAVVAITLHRQELENIHWDQVVKSPCRVCFEIMSKQIGEVICPCQPWGRSWQKGETRVKPDQATSFQCHLRIPNDRLHDGMRISGNCGLFSTPKDSNHQVDKSYSVIWDDRSMNDLQVLAASMQSSLGIVVSIRAGGKKISRGIRCKRSDYQDVFKIMKPGISIPSTIVINHVAKIAPTPIGASAEAISSFLEKMSWEAKPLKPLGGECWLIGATTKFEDVFGFWNQQAVMVSWLPPKNDNMRSKVVMAATKPIHAMVGSDQVDSLQENDPWSQYKGTANSSIRPDGRNSGPPRTVEGPIEQKFQSQGLQISTLQTQVEHISKQLEKQVKDHGDMQQSVQKEFCKIREETSRGLSDMQKSFDESLHKALQNQDLQLTRNFSELKNLILQKPNPMKKAKTAPAASAGQKRENDDDDDDDDDDDEHEWQIAFRNGRQAVSSTIILLSAILADSVAFCLFAFGCVVCSHIDIPSIYFRWRNYACCHQVTSYDDSWIGPLPWDDFHKFSSYVVLTANLSRIHQCGRCYHWYVFSHYWFRMQNFQKASDTQNCPKIWPPQVCPRGVPQGGLGDPSPKTTGRRLLEIQQFRIVSMSEFNQWLSLRVGEASHPGPSHVRIAVINPTAVYGKVDEIVEIGADAVICSETSLTCSAQKSCQWSFDKRGFKCFWSCAVKSKKDLGDDRPSFRGEAAGTAILSKLESRQHRFEYKTEIWQSCRISSAVLRIGSFEILVIALYGFPDRNAQTIRLNDILLAHAYDMAAKSGLPFIVAGDFNTDVHKLPCFQNYKALGCVEFFSHSRNAWDLQLPPTCRGAT